MVRATHWEIIRMDSIPISVISSLNELRQVVFCPIQFLMPSSSLQNLSTFQECIKRCDQYVMCDTFPLSSSSQGQNRWSSVFCFGRVSDLGGCSLFSLSFFFQCTNYNVFVREVKVEEMGLTQSSESYDGPSFLSQFVPLSPVQISFTLVVENFVLRSRDLSTVFILNSRQSFRYTRLRSLRALRIRTETKSLRLRSTKVLRLLIYIDFSGSRFQ